MPIIVTDSPIISIGSGGTRTFAVTDLVIVQSALQASYNLNVSDAITVSEALTLAQYPIRASFDEPVAVADVPTVNLRSFFSVTDPLTITDSTTDVVAWMARATDALTIGDTVQTPLPGTIQRNVTDQVTTGEIVTLSLSTPINFLYYKILTIRAGQVPSVQGHFPVLLPFVVGDNDLRSIANGGHVAHASGFDIRPYADAAFTTPLSYELVTGSYDAVQGSFTMWVQITAQDGATIYLAYGNSLITSDGSSPATWDSFYQGVFHLGSGVGGRFLTVETGGSAPGSVVPLPEVGGSDVNVADSTSMGIFSPVNHGVTPAVGPIGPVGNFSSPLSQYVALGAAGTHNTALTVEAWALMNAATVGNSMYAVSKGAEGVNTEWALHFDGTNFVFAATNGTRVGVTSALSPSAHTWYRLVGTYDGSTWSLYINGTANGAPVTTSGPVSTSQAHNIGALNAFSVPAFFWDGDIGEIRISSIARLPDWITTDYNNQSRPTVFWITGAEINVGSIGVTDALTVTDTPILSLKSFFNVGDALTIGDTISPLLADFINVTDPLTIGESATVNILTGGKVVVSDQILIGETVSLNIVPVLVVALVESVSVTDTPTLAIRSFVLAVDPVQLSEVVSLLITTPGAAKLVNVTDGVTVGETISASIVTVTQICVPFRANVRTTVTTRSNARPTVTTRTEVQVEDCQPVTIEE